MQYVNFAGHMVSFRTRIKFFYLDMRLKVPNANVLVLNVVYLCNHFKAVLIPSILLFTSRAIKHNAI